MKNLSSCLENDLASRASASFFVAAFELDEGTLFVSDGISSLGSDVIYPIADAINQGGFAIESEHLPEEFQGARWINREVAILECTPDMGSVYDGSILFDGIVGNEPDLTDGRLQINLAKPRERVAVVPDFGSVDADTYPKASAESSGQILPLVIGVVEDCPLMAVSETVKTTLSKAASPGDISLSVGDAKAFPAYGAAWVDDESIFYSSHSDTELLGCSVKSAHAVGTAVVFAGEYVYQAAGNPCKSIDSVRGSDTAFTAESFATDRVFFAKAPLAKNVATRNSVLLQFDSVATSVFTQAFDVTYENGDTIKPVEVYTDTGSGVSIGGLSTGSGTASTKTTGKLSIVPSYTTTGVQALSNGTKYSAPYYHSPPIGAFYGSTYPDETTYARYVFTLTSSEVLAIPSGAEATVTVAITESALDPNVKPDVSFTSNFAINGVAMTSDSVSFTAGATTTFTSTITMVMAATNHTQALLALVMGVSHGVSRTIDQIMSGYYGLRADIRYGYRIASNITAEWSV